MQHTSNDKLITAYCEPWSLRAGETIRLMAASHAPGQVKLDLVRLECGDPGAKGPGFIEHSIASALPATIELARQSLAPGSYGDIALDGLAAKRRISVGLSVQFTRPDQAQVVWALEATSGDAVALVIADGRVSVETGGQRYALREARVLSRRWYDIEIDLELAGSGGTILRTRISARTTRSPGDDMLESAAPTQREFEIAASAPGPLARLWLARAADGGHFDGRIARPRLIIDNLGLAWDLAADMASRRIVETSGHGRHGVLHQLPARGVTGPDWDGSAQSWRERPSHYDAIHFHSDDLYDAQWPVSAELALPADLPSGIYAFRLQIDGESDRVPFFVRPAAGAEHADVALLMPTCTYMAYANHRMLFEGADFVAARNSLSAEHDYVRTHRELGLSCYEKHADGSGVMFSSRRRPVLNLRPGADRWNFTPDTCLNAFLEHLGVGHDIVTDEDLHADGLDALSPYRVIVTGTHPEYWSTAMLDALEQWQRAGGRLMYLGGNGFYWRVAFSSDWPGAIELRRAEDGVRNWQCEPGESYHAFGGEYGGLWRRLARAPNQLVGIGFAAQGFERAVGYQRQPGSDDPRAAWIFDGVPQQDIGTSGLGGGAAGQEIDRYDPSLGSPRHALVLASATAFGADMLRTKEEFEAAMVPSIDDPMVRADVVFYETPAGGAVFSVGSISWFGALARNGYDNDVARITANVVRRFAAAEPFRYPASTADD